MTQPDPTTAADDTGPGLGCARAELLDDFASRLRQPRPKLIGPYRLLDEIGQRALAVKWLEAPGEQPGQSNRRGGAQQTRR